ncbi:polyketide cyclase [Shewanella sp. UCD-FRSSP16_17]|uniref:SRPBCC family protein n=1 Tax=Shewanella sp. UCD-FRSSP16_17 TaxID=1853256 RepID=UPI0007EEE05C|nr:SRPBCC family protein [Shewanella sp. UCD-FRSSP16_17]OBT06863.1 polyketide cyclase [Shewanella sp. UCD-FRSSP16_17]
MIKKILLVVAILIAIPFIAAIFIKKDYSVERTIVINQPKAIVFDYVKHLKNQNNFSKWAQMDPDMEKTYRGTDATVGFVSAWASDNPDVGVGEQEIMAIVEGERIDFELRFLSPFEATEPAYMTTEALSDNQTRLNWGFKGHLDYPMNLMFLFMDFETIIGNDLQQGLDSLKLILD